MAVKVIERKPRKVTCPVCKAKLEFTSEDIKHRITNDEFDNYGEISFIICPDCESEVKL